MSSFKSPYPLSPLPAVPAAACLSQLTDSQFVAWMRVSMGLDPLPIGGDAKEQGVRSRPIVRMRLDRA
jgi:hypothetical protein